MQEAGETEVVLQIGEGLLRERLPKSFKQDVVLAMALAYVDLSRDYMALSPPDYIRGCEVLERALKLLHVRLPMQYLCLVLYLEYLGSLLETVNVTCLFVVNLEAARSALHLCIMTILNCWMHYCISAHSFLFLIHKFSMTTKFVSCSNNFFFLGVGCNLGFMMCESLHYLSWR